GATNYTWTVPTGATITSGQGTTAITVNYGTNSGSVTVTPSNSCGNGGLSSTSVTIAPCGSAPVAEFSATPKNICEGETVSFTDLSSNTPTSWSWTFVGGTPSSSTSQNPTITYNTAGTYQVQLTATNAGGSDIETKSAYITVSAPTGVILDTANIRVQDCGITLSSATSIIFADIVANATGYQFEVTNTSLGFTYTSPWWYNARWIRLMDIPGVQPNTTYNVRVKAKNGRCDFGYYGASCAITTHSNPVWNTSVIDPQCGISLNDINSVIYAKPITGATNYIFEISNTTLGYVRTINLTFRYVRMSWWANSLQPNTTYDIKVKVIVNGITGNYSKVCQVTTPSSFRISIPDDEIQYVESLTSPIQLIIYPNPSQGEFVYMELKSSEDISELIVTDITGKVVHQQNLQADDYYSTVRFNEKLNSGFYFVTVISGSQKQTKKLVVK
ncbi:MAG: PKD domain-containing protein, partial [Flavobacteriales bacterium]|nr:PKD domain-containing protein [Flavobacteriales bacterium]